MTIWDRESHSPTRADWRRSGGGFSLVEILVALSVLTIIGAAMVFGFNFHKSYGDTLNELMHTIGDSANRFALDTGCYPWHVSALFNKNYGETNNKNSCKSPVGALWNGPYMKAMPLDPNGVDVASPQIAPNMRLIISDVGRMLPGGPSNQYAVIAERVPRAVAEQAYLACGGASSNCVLAAGGWTGTTYTLFYVFSQFQ